MPEVDTERDCETFDVNVDIVMCIDATGSMSPVIDMVKATAKTFHPELVNVLRTYGREVEQLRIKVVEFRDFTCDGASAMNTSRFFLLPQEASQFEEFVNGIHADGGGDQAESGLDAIGIAMDSDWVKEGAKKRHIVLLFTDAPTKDAGTNDQGSGVPKNNGELLAWWCDPQEGRMNQSAKRLIVFAPECDSWKILDSMDNSVWVKTRLDEGLRDMDMEIIMNTISASI